MSDESVFLFMSNIQSINWKNIKIVHVKQLNNQQVEEIRVENYLI